MMVQRRDLNAPPGQKLADVVKALREKAESSKTGAHGVKHMGEHGDSTWVDPQTGKPESVRDLPPRIDATQEAIDEAKVELEVAQGAIDAAEQAIIDERTEREQLAVEAGQKFVELDGHIADANGKLDLAFPDGAFDVADELSRTVRSSVVQYARGSSETTAPTAGWSVTAPARTPGSFIWFRTVITYGDDSTATSGAALLTGNAGSPGAPGDDGTPGKDGVGLASTTISYAQSTSGTTAPTTGWTATVPALVKGRYLWTRTVWGYTDSTSETGYSVAYVPADGSSGTDGLPGKDGVGVRSTTITYAVSSSGTTAPTAGWVASPPAATAGQFMWTRTVWTYTDNSTETGYSVGKIGNTGSPGADGTPGSPGAQGVGVTSVTPYFRDTAAGAAKPAKPTTLTPSGWATTEPAWAPARDLYRVERVLYTNGSFAYTDVSKIAAYAGIDAAMAAANGKNLNTYTDLAAASKPGPAPAPNSARTVGDVHRNRDTTTGEIWAEYQWTGTVWKEVSFGDQILRSLDVGKITGGTGSFQEFFSEHFIADTGVINQLWLDQLVGKIALFQQLTIASGNLIANGDFSQGMTYWRDVGQTVEPVTDLPGQSAALSYSGGMVSAAYHGPRFKMTGGEKYIFECWIRADKPNSRFYFEIRDQTNALVGTNSTIIEGGSGSPSSYMMSSYPVPTTWTKYRMEFTARAGAVDANVASLYYNHTSGTERAARVWLTGVSVRPKSGVVHIADGTVGADKVIADEVAAAVSHLVEARVEKLTVTAGATINEAVILKLASEMITAGVLRTAETGQRVVIDESGIVLYGVGPDGEDTELVRIGPSGENLITAGDTTISPAGVRAPAGSFDQLNVGGDDLTGLLERLPRGMRAWGQLTKSSQLSGRTNIMERRGELQTTLEPNRLYRCSLSEHFVEVSGGTNTNIIEELRFTYDAVPVNVQDTPDAGTNRGVFARQPVFAGAATVVNGMEFMINTGDWSGDRTFWLMWLMRTETASRPVRVLATGFYSPVLSIEDLGPAQSDVLKRWNDGDGGGGATEPQDPAPTIVRRTDTWAHGGVGGDMRNGTVYQGTLAPYGNRYGGWLFSSAMRSALSGATIEKFEVYLENAHWWYGSGGTAVIYPNNGSYKGILGSGVTSANWPKYAGRWVTIPASWYASIVSGTYKGVSTYTTNADRIYYGQFKGAPTKFRVTYRK